MKFRSELYYIGRVQLPPFSGIRVMMMPFYLHDPIGSLPSSLDAWKHTVQQISAASHTEGVGYLTIDEAFVRAGETHRRPGLHVDGVGPDGLTGGWGGDGGWGGGRNGGMFMVSSHVGCRAWDHDFEGAPGLNGDCSHLQVSTLEPYQEYVLMPNELWWCSSLCVHEALPMEQDTHRQFCRVSMPSTAPWYRGYTANPLGILPTGPIHSGREDLIAYRP